MNAIQKGTILAFAAACGFASAAHAQGACAGDIDKFCKGNAAGRGGIMTCLQSHEADLSDGCKQQFAVMQNKKEEVHEACQSDAARYCKGIEPGGGRIATCLDAHQADLSDACKQVIQKRDEMRARFHAACGADIDKYCQGQTPEGGQVWRCLKSHEDNLSDGCKSMLMHAREHLEMRQGQGPAPAPAPGNEPQQPQQPQQP